MSSVTLRLKPSCATTSLAQIDAVFIDNASVLANTPISGKQWGIGVGTFDGFYVHYADTALSKVLRSFRWPSNASASPGLPKRLGFAISNPEASEAR
jgi:hypothetical protein